MAWRTRAPGAQCEAQAHSRVEAGGWQALHPTLRATQAHTNQLDGRAPPPPPRLSSAQPTCTCSWSPLTPAAWAAHSTAQSWGARMRLWCLTICAQHQARGHTHACQGADTTAVPCPAFARDDARPDRRCKHVLRHHRLQLWGHCTRCASRRRCRQCMTHELVR
jgi:hypothetical protein